MESAVHIHTNISLRTFIYSVKKRKWEWEQVHLCVWYRGQFGTRVLPIYFFSLDIKWKRWNQLLLVLLVLLVLLLLLLLLRFKEWEMVWLIVLSYLGVFICKSVSDHIVIWVKLENMNLMGRSAFIKWTFLACFAYDQNHFSLYSETPL